MFTLLIVRIFFDSSELLQLFTIVIRSSVVSSCGTSSMDNSPVQDGSHRVEVELEFFISRLFLMLGPIHSLSSRTTYLARRQAPSICHFEKDCSISLELNLLFSIFWFSDDRVFLPHKWSSCILPSLLCVLIKTYFAGIFYINPVSRYLFLLFSNALWTLFMPHRSSLLSMHDRRRLF